VAKNCVADGESTSYARVRLTSICEAFLVIWEPRFKEFGERVQECRVVGRTFFEGS